MKMRISCLAITMLLFIFLLPEVVIAVEYNLSCIFTPKIQLVNISLDMVGAGDYFPYLVENNNAFYSVKLITVGNWSQYQYNIYHRTIVQCDGEQRTLGVTLKINTYKLPNGTVMSDFIDDGRFYVPEDKKHCQVILTKIYATNQSWERESGCEYGINNCLCFVKGLSGNSESIDREVLTKEQFFAKKAIITSKEIAEEQATRDRWNIITGAIIGSILAGVFTIVGVIISERSAKGRIKLEKTYEERVKAYNKLYKIFTDIGISAIQIEQINKSKDSKFFKEFAKYLIKQRLYPKLIVKLYPFFKSESFMYLSEKLREAIFYLIRPIFYNESIYNEIVDLEEDIMRGETLGVAAENKIKWANNEYKRGIDENKVIETIVEIEKQIYSDLELYKIKRELERKSSKFKIFLNKIIGEKRW